MIDIIITSSSRPQLFPHFWESFKKMVHIRGDKKVVVHEDFVFPKESRKVEKYINELQQKGEIQEYYSDSPAIGLGKTLDWLIKKKIETKYILYLQEDWEFERPIDLDQLIWVMDNNSQINEIFFNKTKNFKTLNGAEQKQYTYDKIDMCLYHGWTFLPGIWRMDFVKKYWRMREVRPEGYFTNAFGSHEQRINCDYCEKNLGVYILGKTTDYRHVRHLGDDWRMAEWRLKKGNPGGVYSEFQETFAMPPWIPFVKRPVQNLNPSKEDIEIQSREEPVEAQNAKMEK